MADTVGGEDFSKMKVVDLKKALKEKGLSTTGSKSELVERLTKSLHAEPVQEESISLQEPELATTEIKENNKELAPATNTAVLSEPTKPEAETEPTKIQTQSLSAEEKLQKRAERFGVLSPEIKKQARAERFGIVNEETKKQARAERFGIVSSQPSTTKSSTGSQGSDVDVLKKRAERFGQIVSSTLSKVDELERIRKRKQRFGEDAVVSAKTTKISYNSTSNSTLEEQKRKRAERFGLS